MFTKVIVASAVPPSPGWVWAASRTPPARTTPATPTANTYEETKQVNHGDQFVGDNLNVDRISRRVIQGHIDKAPGICPSVANDNEIG